MQVIESKTREVSSNNSFFGEFSDCRMPAGASRFIETTPYDTKPMVNTFGILSAIVLAFSAFVAFKNKEEFEKQDIATKAEQGRLETNTKTYKGLVASIKQLESDTADANKSRDDYRAKVEAQDEKNATVQAEIDDKEKELAATKKEVADAQEKLKELGDLEELAPKLERLQASIAELKDQVAILNTQIDRLRGEKSRTGEALAAAKKKQSQITSGQSFPTMKTKIRSIDRRLGIVTLAAGMRSGVIGGSKVAVMRGGEKIAELNVKAVSANLATADVIQSTLKEGENVAPGDIVIPVESATKEKKN
jgi:predicted  nucleic acid-binding Zn-ribbon protein